MYIGRVRGSVMSTIKNEVFEGRRLLVVDRLSLDGEITGEYDICVDVAQAGPGDVVLVLDEGNSSRQILGREPDGAIRTVLAGVIDEISLQAKSADSSNKLD
jgi:microcompartment protein CcmK/EutM